MIADTAVFSTSPWQKGFLSKDSYRTVSLGDVRIQSFDTDLAALEAEIEKMKRMSGTFDVHNGSCCTSIAGSECSDTLDTEDSPDCLFVMSEDHEYLHPTGFINVLDDSDIHQDMVTPTEFEWSDPDTTPAMSSLLGLNPGRPTSPVEVEPAPTHTVQKRKHTTAFTDNKSWSQMSHTEQVSIIENLTEIISKQMGLREQLEIIKIINPAAFVSPADTEFIIDLECLNDKKLQQIRELVQQHTSSSSSASDSSCSDCGSPAQKKQAKRGRRLQTKGQRQRQRKEHKQTMKEKRSGLFKQEEVLSLRHCEPDEADDIDILT